MMSNFAAFILSNGRADNVVTYKTIRKAGYTGRIVVIIDNADSEIEEYKKRYADEVYIFNKEEIAKITDQGDNFNNLRTTTHVRNAIFDAAEELKIESFVMLDDDYTDFRFKFSASFKYADWIIKKNLDNVFECMVQFLHDCPRVSSIAFSQGGDFIGGKNGSGAEKVRLKRKCMNSFFCITKRRFKFISRLNEDVNTYITLGAMGDIFFTTNQVALQQKETQTNSGGMTEAYLDGGTYVKSFYSVMYAPSCVKIRTMGSVHPRLHHNIKWRNCVPKIIKMKGK